MTDRKVVLTDVDGRVHQESFRFSGEAPSSAASAEAVGWSLAGRTLHGGPSEGVALVEFHNGCFKLHILPTRGMGIWKAECGGVTFGWDSPVRRPVHPAFVNLTGRDGLGWLTGFNEWICRCGLAWNGPPGVDPKTGETLTLHGRIANLPAHHVWAELPGEGSSQLAVTGVVEETSLFGPCLRLESTIRAEVGANRFTIADRVTNLAGIEGEMQLLYHINTGRPVLEPGARFAVPVKELTPKDQRAAEGMTEFAVYGPPEPGFAEQVYLSVPLSDADGRTVALLRNAAGDTGFSLRWTTTTLPYFVVWKNTVAEADGYVTGLEPSTNFPHFKSFEREQGRVVVLPPGGTWEAEIEIAFLDSAEAVSAVEAEIESLQRRAPATIHQRPQAGFSPVGES